MMRSADARSEPKKVAKLSRLSAPTLPVVGAMASINIRRGTLSTSSQHHWFLYSLWRAGERFATRDLQGMHPPKRRHAKCPVAMTYTCSVWQTDTERLFLKSALFSGGLLVVPRCMLLSHFSSSFSCLSIFPTFTPCSPLVHLNARMPQSGFHP